MELLCQLLIWMSLDTESLSDGQHFEKKGKSAAVSFRNLG
jgi:hypothetical protein